MDVALYLGDGKIGQILGERGRKKNHGYTLTHMQALSKDQNQVQ